VETHSGVGKAAPDSLIDDIRIYRRALAAAEIKALYTSEVSRLSADTPNGHVPLPVPETNVAFSNTDHQ
jgi:hypothetical protein